MNSMKGKTHLIGQRGGKNEPKNRPNAKCGGAQIDPLVEGAMEYRKSNSGKEQAKKSMKSEKISKLTVQASEI